MEKDKPGVFNRSCVNGAWEGRRSAAKRKGKGANPTSCRRGKSGQVKEREKTGKKVQSKRFAEYRINRTEGVTNEGKTDHPMTHL